MRNKITLTAIVALVSISSAQAQVCTPQTLAMCINPPNSGMNPYVMPTPQALQPQYDPPPVSFQSLQSTYPYVPTYPGGVGYNPFNHTGPLPGWNR
jgi:hypothetical protein